MSQQVIIKLTLLGACQHVKSTYGAQIKMTDKEGKRFFNRQIFEKIMRDQPLTIVVDQGKDTEEEFDIVFFTNEDCLCSKRYRHDTMAETASNYNWR